MLMGHYLTYDYSYILEIYTVGHFHVKIFDIFTLLGITHGIFCDNKLF